MAFSHKEIKKYLVLIILAGCFFIGDRFLKILALNLNSEKVLIKDWLEFYLVKNSNGAFSLNYGFDIVWLAIIIIVIALIWLRHALQKKDFLRSLALIILVLGALSNIYDRLIYGAVIDYLVLVNLSIFNLADCLIVMAAGLLLISERDAKQKN